MSPTHPSSPASKPRPSSQGGLMSRSQGFSIVEMMLGIVLTAICVASIESAIMTSRALFYRQKVLTQAISVGESVTEDLLLLDSSDDDLVTGVHTSYFDSNGGPLEETAEGDAPEGLYYTAEWTITDLDEVPGIRTIELEIAWDESGAQRSIQWHTYRN